MAGIIAVQLRNKRQRELQSRLDAESDTEEERLNLPPNYFRQPKNIRPPGLEIPKDQKGRHFQAKGPRKDKADENHANYRKRNKVSENDEDTTNDQINIDQLDGEDGVYRASSSANVVLYVGLGMISIGLVITFVGLGDKGFRTLELKLVGPSLVGCGLFFSLLRILFCTIPSCCRACCKCCRKTEDHEVLLEQDNEGPLTKHPVMISSHSKSDSGSRVAPSKPNSGRSSGRRTPKKPPRSRSDDENEDPSDLESSGEFKRKTLKNSQTDGEATTFGVGDTSVMATSSRGGVRGRLRGRQAAKPLTYDNYSTDSSSQFSVDVVEVETISRPNLESEVADGGSDTEAGIGVQTLEAREIVLNASRLKVESETA